MKLSFTCRECLSKTNLLHRLPAVATLPLHSSPLYVFACAYGHQNNVILRHTKFEVLAEVGLQAIIDGYYREGVSSFAASLERFYEYYIRLVSLHLEIAEEVLEETWRSVKSQSERQLGLFMGLFYRENCASPPILHKKCVELRNRVIHQGEIPTEQDAVDFAQAVVNIVQPILADLAVKYAEAVATTRAVHNVRAMNQEHQGPYYSRTNPMVYSFRDPVPAEPPCVSAEIARRRNSNYPV